MLKTALKTAAAAAAILSGLAGSAHALSEDGKVRIGLLYTLSGPAAILGEQSRDGFLLALEKLGGTLGGLEVELHVVDDEQKPDLAVSRARELVESDKVDFVVGPIFSNVLYAILPAVTEEAFLISTNAGTSLLAGAECNENLFVTSYQNDQIHQVSGEYAQEQGYPTAYLITPNYQAGKDAMAGFKRSFKGEILGETLVPLGQLDYSGELAQIAAAQPAAIYAFMPGGMGVNFVKQFKQSGLDYIPFLSAFTVDESTLPAQKGAALGMFSGANWAPDLDTPQNIEFAAAYVEAYGRVPASFAFQAYDAALLIDSAIKGVGGDLSDMGAVRSALEAAEFTSLRGDFAFSANHFPVQDFYLTKVVERADGKFATSIVKTIFEDYADPYLPECKM